ncbi:MAG: FAD:protein FMN transferase [Tissierellia bacterium]|nr:FAD:protein FMN transferase [Tissierellia bacterium]
MRKRLSIILLISIFMTSLVGCQGKDEVELNKYKHTFLNVFDTVVDITIYEETKEEADVYNEYIENRFKELHKLYDKYHTYEGVNNIKTINDNAGIEPVKVNEELFNIISDSINWYHMYSDKTDISMGALINVWSKYRDIHEVEGADELSIEKRLPTQEELEIAASYTGIDKIVLDSENMTVFIDNENTQIDVGAVAKGYATELIAQEVMEMGLDSGIINAGGNVRTIGVPKDGVRSKWGIAIDNPIDSETLIEWVETNGNDSTINTANEEDYTEVVYVNDMSIVTSGDYQRFFVVDGKLYHHLIDKETMYPGDNYRLVSILTEDSGLADFLSTAVFLMAYDEGRELVDSIDGVEAIWLMKDKEKIYTDGMKDIMLSTGATGGK